jgi:hypothetical protein
MLWLRKAIKLHCPWIYEIEEDVAWRNGIWFSLQGTGRSTPFDFKIHSGTELVHVAPTFHQFMAGATIALWAKNIVEMPDPMNVLSDQTRAYAKEIWEEAEKFATQ